MASCCLFDIFAGHLTHRKRSPLPRWGVLMVAVSFVETPPTARALAAAPRHEDAEFVLCFTVSRLRSRTYGALLRLSPQKFDKLRMTY